jgi:transcriptional regulator with XRE-family HTH domain
MSIFQGLGRSLRWLRDRQGKRQYQVADAAGITKAMLSAYETGKQKPSLDTLEKILLALECDLNDLHNALQIVNERPEALRRGQRENAWFRRDPGEPAFEERGEGAGRDLYRILGVSRRLPLLEEEALSQMLEGFQKLLRYFHSTTAQPAAGPLDPDLDEEPS